MVTIKDIKEAKQALKGVIKKTPFSYAPILSRVTNAQIFIKKENLQNTGAFKIRGAFNKISSLSDNDKKRGVIAASAEITHKALLLVHRILV
jgi:threonine dehydratase